MAELSRYEETATNPDTGLEEVVEANTTDAEGSEFISETVLQAHDDATLVDYHRRVIYGNDGIRVEGNTFTNVGFAEQIVEFDDTGRPVAQAIYDVTYGPKAKEYGDGSYWRQPSFSRDITGHTTLSGLVAVISSTNPFVKGDVLVTLPAGYAPNVAETFVCVTDSGFARVDVLPSGEVKLNTTMNVTSYISLSGIHFFSPQG